MNTADSTPVQADVPAGHIEFWFDFGSTYSYLAAMRIEGMASLRGVKVLWRPFLLGPIFKAFGWQSSPFLEQKEKLAYMWRDMERQCRKYGLQWRRPTVFPRSAVLPLRVVLAWAEAPWIADFCRLAMLQNFAQDREIEEIRNVEAALAALSLPVASVLARAQSQENKLELRRQTERARALGVFGGPTFFAGREMFWGNDRLEDAIEQAYEGLQ